jgi:hypothetical protein
MKIRELKYLNNLEGEAVISLNRSELSTLCCGLYLLNKQKDSKYNRNLDIQMKVARDILDYGSVDDFTFNTAVEREE